MHIVPSDAVIVADDPLPAVFVLTTNVADVFPAGMRTVAGVVA